MIPAYNRRDIEYLLKYFAQKESEPLFIHIDEIDRDRLNITNIAEEIVQKDMRRSEQSSLINELWDDEKNLLRVYFGNKYFFKRQLDIEIDKILGEFPLPEDDDNTTDEILECESLSLYELSKIKPIYARRIRDTVFANAQTDDGQYRCQICGKESPHKALFNIDHIFPMSKGGMTRIDNLQLLCRKCNFMKGDSV